MWSAPALLSLEEAMHGAARRIFIMQVSEALTRKLMEEKVWLPNIKPDSPPISKIAEEAAEAATRTLREQLQRPELRGTIGGE